MFATAPLSSGMVRTLPLSWWAALSVGAAAIHFAVIPEHFEEWAAFGLAFALIGWFQVVWPFAYLERPTRAFAWAAIAVNLATVLVWAWSRTAGLPIGPEPGVPEAIGAPDLIATAFEVALVVGLLATLVIGRRADPDGEATDRPNGIGVINATAWIVVAVLSTAALALGGGAG